MGNHVDNSSDIHSDNLLELVEFKVLIPGYALASAPGRTFDKLKTNIKRGLEVGGWVEECKSPTSYQWGVKGKLPMWVVQEIMALAQNELSLYYQSVRHQRNHPTNGLNKRRPY